MTTSIPTSRGLFTLVDDEDAERVLAHKWHAWTSDHQRGTHYARAHIGGKIVYLHRFLMSPAPRMVVDHINGDAMDNRRSNLRVCTPSENQRNRTKGTASNSSGYVGVHWDKEREFWSSSITVDGKGIYLGRWDSAEDAALARDIATLVHHGDFGQYNILTHNLEKVP